MIDISKVKKEHQEAVRIQSEIENIIKSLDEKKKVSEELEKTLLVDIGKAVAAVI